MFTVYIATLVNHRLCAKSVADDWHVASLQNKYVHDVPSHIEIIFQKIIHNKYQNPIHVQPYSVLSQNAESIMHLVMACGMFATKRIPQPIISCF